MAIEYKRLGTARPASGVETALYTVPTGKQAVISSLIATNTSGSINHRFVVSALNAAGEAMGTANFIAVYVPLAPNSTYSFTEGWTLAAGQTIAVATYDGSEVNYNLFGSEMPA